VQAGGIKCASGAEDDAEGQAVHGLRLHGVSSGWGVGAGWWK
jgi:hypothetical protein